MLAQAIQQMQADGASGIILACTEAPMALEHAAPEVQALCLDSTQTLAQATVALWQQLSSSSTKEQARG
jgi:aspartate/glutamate racemase